ncbi:MAG: hypothetical protein HPY50_14310 [Firmicutes bacterium]|nr:hypothetical protein [Bacillota bacterium]
MPLDKISRNLAVEEIVRLNEKSSRYGLALTHLDALQLVETRGETLRAVGRIEIGGSTIGKIIEAFCDSSYINQQDYADTLHELLEVFYYMKNETLDLVPDDELIGLMKSFFERSCRGSLELLKNRELELMARNLRFGVPGYADVGRLDDRPLDGEEDDDEY